MTLGGVHSQGERPTHRAPSHCLGCSSERPPTRPIPPPLTIQVRESNGLAIGMYKKLGYSIYRQVIGYYSGEEDAFDMRKALSRDTDGKSCVPLNPLAVYPNELD